MAKMLAEDGTISSFTEGISLIITRWFRMYQSAFILAVAPGFSFCHLYIVFMLQSKAMPYS